MALTVRPIQADEYDTAATVAWASFQHLAVQYQSAQGAAAIAAICSAPEIRARDAAGAATWVALVQDTIIGLIQVRGDGHITLLFVLPELQSRGVGRALIRAADAVCPLRSVNASPNSVMAYMRYGFMPIAAQQTSENGISYQPMQRS
ncbi:MULTISPECIES: GNAT family N-acetyltransferase [Chitinibacter]|uniref:GNAT family N-acetyltransferase n=1 Tax=Chitinibacter TaxID=230666 RepID=UPI00040D422A|nr:MULTISPECIES: GNAT family N-acetyltransferase [Chitinibacter]